MNSNKRISIRNVDSPQANKTRLCDAVLVNGCIFLEFKHGKLVERITLDTFMQQLAILKKAE